ncbi:MAG: S8 family peptidase [Solirubrobacteraceae bacterium]
MLLTAAAAALDVAPAAGQSQALAPQVAFADAATLPDIGPGPRRVTVCVVDSGTDPDSVLQHALTERIGVDNGSGRVNTPRDHLRRRHGTLVSQVVAGTGPTLRAGIWPLAKLRTVAALNRRGRFDWASVALGIHGCLTDPQVLVINLSLGRPGGGVPADVETALARARTAGVNVVVSAGNTAAAPVSGFDSSPGVISVGGVDASGRLCSSSHSRPDVLGLSCGVRVTDAAGAPLLRNGTSFAAPQVSAVLAAIRGHAPALTADQAARALITGAKRTSFAPIVNARGALHAAGVDLPPSAPLPKPVVSARSRGGQLRITVSNRPSYATIVVGRGGEDLRRTIARSFRVPARGGPVRVMFELGGVRSVAVAVGGSR